jgi:methyl-accepting chemotaxis protein
LKERAVKHWNDLSITKKLKAGLSVINDLIGFKSTGPKAGDAVRAAQTERVKLGMEHVVRVVEPGMSDRGFCRESVDAIAKNLRGCSAGLVALNGSTEDDFLTTGRDLRDVATRTGQISTTAKSIADLVSGRDFEGYIEALQKLFERMNTYLALSRKKLNHNSETLLTILKTSDSIALHLAGFNRIVKHLRILGISTRIESARLVGGHDAFSNIADDVNKLSDLINSKSAGILQAVMSTHEVISETLSKVNLFEARQQGQSQTMLDDIIRNLPSLSEKHELSSTAAYHIIERTEEISRNVGEIVSSLQFHDITRQQIEHVIEVINELSNKMSSPKERESLQDLSISNVCRLQVNQLNSAKQEFVSAIGGAMDSFRHIAGNAMEMSKEVAALAGATGASGASFLARLRTDVAKIIATLNENGEANHRLLTAVESVVATIGDLTTFVGGIDEIGVDIDLLALNAQIRAVHTGSDGAALGVLAEAVRSLSDDARGQTVSVSETLTHISAIAQGLGRAEAEEDEIEELDEMVERLGGILDSLAGMDGQVTSLVNLVEGTTNEVEMEIKSLISGITVHERIESELNGAVAGLAGIEREAGKLGPATGENHDTAYLKQLEQRYTMDKERSIHHSSIHANGPTVPFFHHGPEEGLGENVELF